MAFTFHLPTDGPNTTSGDSARSTLPLIAVVAIDAVGNGVILPLLPFYSTRLGATPLTVGLLLAAFSFCQFVAAPLLGRASDRAGRKRLLVVSQAGTVAGLTLLALSHSLLPLFAARALAGASAGNVAIATAMAVDQSGETGRRRAIAMISIAMGVGTMVGPALAGVLTPFALTAPIWAAALLSLSSMIAGALLLPADVFGRTGSFKQRFGKRTWRSRRRLAPAVGLGAGARAAEFPAPSKRMLDEFTALATRPSIALILSSLLAFYFAFGMFTAQLALVLHARFTIDGRPFGPREVGYVFMIAGGISILVQTVLLKRIARVLSDEGIAIVGCLLLAGGIATVGNVTAIPMLAGAIVAASCGSALGRPALIALLSISAPTAAQGTAMGLAQSIGSLVNVLAPILAGLLIAAGRYETWATVAASSALLGAVLVTKIQQRGKCAEYTLPA